MKIWVPGTGSVETTLAGGFAKRGHNVMLGSRIPEREKLKDWSKGAGNDVSTGTFEQAASDGDVLVFAVLGSAVDTLIALAGAKNFAGKLVVETANALDQATGRESATFSRQAWRIEKCAICFATRRRNLFRHSRTGEQAGP